MAATAERMNTLASQARARATSVRDELRKKEEAELKIQIAGWRKREKKKAKRAIGQLSSAIERLAGQGRENIVAQVEVEGPYLISEIMDACKVLCPWGHNHLLDFEIPDSPNCLSLHKIRNLRDGARMIAGWALRQGFSVQYQNWRERIGRDNIRHYEILEIDPVTTSVFVGSHRNAWPVTEGLLISW